MRADYIPEIAIWNRTYSKLIKMDSFIERYRYLKLTGNVGEETFGSDRYLNQMFYRTSEWLDLRKYIILRDKGCDLATPGMEISGKIYIHHMNPISKKDIAYKTEFLLDPENLVCCSFNTHQAIHYGDEHLLPQIDFVERKPNDTVPWK